MSDSEGDFESAEEFDFEPKETPKKDEKPEMAKQKPSSNATETTKTTTQKTIPKTDPVISEPQKVSDGWDIDDWDVDEEASAEKIVEKPKGSIENCSRAVDNMKIKVTEPAKPIMEPEYDVRNALDRLDSKETTWGGWGLSFLSTASKSVANMTTQAVTGISKTLESGLAPSPEELAQTVVREEKNSKTVTTPVDDSSSDAEKTFKLDHLISGVSSISGKVISKAVNSSLDTLEGIGKKTMSIIQENDPGLLNRRKLLMNDGPVLSQVLREAKEKTEDAEKKLKQVQKNSYHKKVHFETLFDDYCGIVHLEALEMLSKQAQIKLQTLLAPLSGKALQEIELTLNEIEELCELPEMDDEAQNHSLEELERRLKAITEELSITLDFDDITESWKKYSDWLESNTEASDPKKVYLKSMNCLAETAALSVAKIHKLAEKYLILDQHSTANEVDSLVELTVCFCWHLTGISSKFGEVLSAFPSDDDNNTQFITSIFLEATNSNKYIQNAFGLVIPIVQLGAA